MKMKLSTILTWSACLIVAVACGLAGCDSSDSSDPDTDGVDGFFDSHPFVSDPRYEQEGDVTINPTTVTNTYEGQEFVFHAAGGTSPYSWDVAYSSRGRVTKQGERQAVYTSRALQENSVIVYDQAGHAAIAQVLVGATNLLTLVADNSTLTNDGAKAVITVSGGTEPYRWSLDNSNGDLDHRDGTTVVYTRRRSGDNAVHVYDYTGAEGDIVIHQPDEAEPELSITADRNELDEDGEKTVVMVSGGTPPYTWTVDNSNGYIDRTTGDSIVYTRTATGDNALRVRDRFGLDASIVIRQPEATSGALSVTPDAATLENNFDAVQLVASGGSFPYSWTTDQIVTGGLESNTGSNVVYRRISSGNNAVTVTDGEGASVRVPITQP
jgi:hypothetical protein